MPLQVRTWLGSEEKNSGAWQAGPDSGSFSRIWRVFMAARIAIATVLVLLQALLYSFGTTASSHTAITVCVAYLCATLAVWLWARPKPPGSTFDLHWVLTIGLDVITFSVLNFLPSSGINYTPLFALPVLLASVLGPILLAFGTAASVTLLLLLGDAWWTSAQSAGDANARFLQSALSGSGFFLVALLANQLALRLAREETLAKTSQSAARMQTQVNELVIEALAEGIVVVDDHGTVHAANPASMRLLTPQKAVRVPFLLGTETAWQPLAALAHHTFATQSHQKADIYLEYPKGHARRLRVHTRLAASQSGTQESLCVMFLEDLREMEARVRTEKMAAMGRMSAAVAHEIRNPLAAITQANALLEEDLHAASQRQLTTMIGQNAQRLAKIVDEVLDIARAQAELPTPLTTTLPLDDTIQRITTDWASQNSAVQRAHVITDAAHVMVRFETEHLRRVMINLLDNALRYATTSAHAIEISTQRMTLGQARLAVWSDGLPLEKSVQTHLFEPFFSSESRSSGLGLYICRELCERYGALIGYQRVHRSGMEGNEFFVVFKAASQPLNAVAPSFDTVIV
jgi:two-component system sensor histidine kinase PilS (NtrC family)